MTFNRTFLSGVLYVALALGANPALTAPLDRDSMLELRQGEMRKLAIHKQPHAIATATITNMAGEPFTLADFTGKYVLLNFWATWCAPCRKEMPALDILQQTLGGDNFQVVLIATGRNPDMAIKSFFDEINIQSLSTYLDPKQQLSREKSVFGLPITVLLDPEGWEIARMRGDADWSSAEAIAFLTAVIAGDGS